MADKGAFRILFITLIAPKFDLMQLESEITYYRKYNSSPRRSAGNAVEEKTALIRTIKAVLIFSLSDNDSLLWLLRICFLFLLLNPDREAHSAAVRHGCKGERNLQKPERLLYDEQAEAV